MIARPKPKSLSSDAVKAIISASSQQTGRTAPLKSYDPNFPVFDTPVNSKVLVYIPNHTVMLPDGSTSLRWDKFAAHATLEGRSYGNCRCTSGIMDESLGLDGSCPLCDGMGEVWDLYHKEYNEIAKARNIDPDSPEAKEGLKSVREELRGKRAIKEPEVWITFPIVVIECTEQDGKKTATPKKDEAGRISGKPMWYSIRERTYNDKWVKALETVATDDDIAPTNPAGLWAILNFEYDAKNGKHDKMGSAKALSVGYKTMAQSYNAWAQEFDKMTEDWTPEKAMEVVVLDALRDMEETRVVADTLLKPVRDRINLYNLGAGGVAGAPQVAGGVPADANSALASFGATPEAIPTSSASTDEVPTVPQTPLGEVPDVGIQ